jgi:hypothetical protein
VPAGFFHLSRPINLRALRAGNDSLAGLFALFVRRAASRTEISLTCDVRRVLLTRGAHGDFTDVLRALRHHVGSICAFHS